MTRLLWLVVLLPLVMAQSPYAGDELKAPGASLLHEQVLQVPGDPGRPVTFQMTLYTPPGQGPFPLAVMNRGSARTVPPREPPRYHLTFSAYYL
ncbi:hypothetical protein [Paraburkholderia kururiensis]|uniref:hypothetical protein n=1 Tax=Paraburkholderia kururiensis TaxID=984307 RepID=UPI0039A6C64C